MFDYFEKEWTMEDLTKEEMIVLCTEWDKLDKAYKIGFGNFETFVEVYIDQICYPDC